MGRQKSKLRLLSAVGGSLALLMAIGLLLLVVSGVGGSSDPRHGPRTSHAISGHSHGTAVSVSPTHSPSPSADCAGLPGSARPNYKRLDACGYPSPDTTGVPAGTQLTALGPVTMSSDGAILRAFRVVGTITVAANDVTIENTEVSTSGQFGIVIEPGYTGTVIRNVTIHGANTTPAGEMQMGIDNEGDMAAVSADRVRFYNGERILSGPGTLTNSFCLNAVDNPKAHHECIYEGGDSVTLTHNTLLTAQAQTAAIFLSTDVGPLGTVKIVHNLLAGGGYALYGGARPDGTGVSSEAVTGNRFSRLYFARGGKWGPAAYMPRSYTWSGNVWDDTGLPVSP